MSHCRLSSSRKATLLSSVLGIFVSCAGILLSSLAHLKFLIIKQTLMLSSRHNFAAYRCAHAQCYARQRGVAETYRWSTFRNLGAL